MRLVTLLVVAAVALDGRRQTAADMACSLPEGPGVLAPKLDLLPPCVSSRCAGRQRWGSSSSSAVRRQAGAPGGDGSERGGDIILPDSCRSTDEALLRAGPGDRVFFREGRFAWDNIAVVRQHMHIAGDDKSCLLGAWLLQADTAGLFQGVCCAVKHRGEASSAISDATITSLSASWIFEDCELRAVRSPVLRLLDSANATLLFCNIGGVGGGNAGIDDDLFRATDAVVAMASSNVLLYRCRVDDTGDMDTRPPRDLQGNIISSVHNHLPTGVRAQHPYRRSGVVLELPGAESVAERPEHALSGGIRVFESAKARLEQCTASNNDVTITVSGSASVFVRKCLLKCPQEAFAVFRAVRSQAKSRLVLRANQIEGKKWLNSERPAVFRDDDDDGICAWEDAAAAADDEAGRNMEQEEPTRQPRRPRGRPLNSRKPRAHPLSEDNLSERDLTILRLGAKGIFDVKFDASGHVILPPKMRHGAPQAEAASQSAAADGGEGAVQGEESAVEGYWNEYVRGKQLEEEATTVAAASKAAAASGVAGNVEGSAQQPDTQVEESRGAGFEGLHADTTNGNTSPELARTREEDEGAGCNAPGHAGEGQRKESEVSGAHLAASVDASGLAAQIRCTSDSSSARGEYPPVGPDAPSLTGDLSDLRLQLDSTSLATSSVRQTN